MYKALRHVRFTYLKGHLSCRKSQSGRNTIVITETAQLADEPVGRAAPENIAGHGADQAPLKTEQIDQASPQMPSMGCGMSSKTTSQRDDEDFKATGASIRVKPAAWGFTQ